MNIPLYPEFASLELSMRDELYAHTDRHPDGACEFLFGSMFLYRKKYSYSISRIKDGCYVLSGKEPPQAFSGKTGSFFCIPAILPPINVIESLLGRFDMWKTITASQRETASALMERGFTLEESRNNFDYLYLRSDLAELRGKKFHKKKNLVNAFLSEFTPELQNLTSANASDAQSVLDSWRRLKGEDGDFEQCTEALLLLDKLNLDGTVVYLNGKAVAFSIGEPMRGGDMYCVHFEKGVDTYRGIFQYINQASAIRLPPAVTLINREQDTGDEGLRQAKMTYRPVSFVEKYIAYKQ
ncbi:MAG: phosphatidylglycerol lysyltransferase domain-containing protein [Spirochaetaceae bacterium]|nr:phosphatidylglycerol lysyltransferase domain-containing protein [Spirochaetaceae bacterium]